MDLHYLSGLLLRFGDLNLALTAYNFCLRFVRKRLKTILKLVLAYSRRVLMDSREFCHQSRGA
jgi:hypothetical protein